MASGVSGIEVPTVGVWLLGEYLGVKREPGRERANGDGFWPDRYKVGVRVGSDVFDVEFQSLDAAESALVSANDGGVPPKGSTVRLPVMARAAKGYIFWMGAGQAPGSGDYE